MRCSQNNLIVILILQISVKLTESSDLSVRACNNENLFTIGTKSSCESENQLSTSCFGNPYKVKRATIRCTSGYYSDLNLSEQVIECLSNYEWSEKPMHCLPECDSNPKTLKLIENGVEKFPPWYVEIIKNSTEYDTINRYPGIILSERAILTKREYCENSETQKLDLQNIADYSIRLPNSKIKTNLYNVAELNIFKSDLCILQLVKETYIKFNSETKPTCGNLKLPEILGDLSLDETTVEYLKNNFLPVFEGECVVPNVDRTIIEVVCYKGGFDDVIECLPTAPYVSTRCQLGYYVKGLDKVPYLTNDENLSECSHNRWYHRFGEDQCKLVCGVIDDNSGAAGHRPLSYKGKKTDIAMAPWHVGIYEQNPDTYEQICGGTIIHINLVISAAHCFYNNAFGKVEPASHYLVGAGKRYRSYEADEDFAYYVGIRTIHIPQNYQTNPLRNDIAVLQLDQYLEFSSHIKPICIDWEPYENINKNEGIQGHLVGWGSTSADDISSPELQRIDLTVITNKECKKRVNPNSRKDVTDEKFCAVSPDNATACSGDSGGGFIIKKNIGYGERFYLAGIVSFGVNIDKYCSDGFVTLFENIFFNSYKVKELISLSRE